jgi:hypothetical protein
MNIIIKNGKRYIKALIIEDSWDRSGLDGRRVITEDFHKYRNFFAAYPINFVFEEGAEKPKYHFAKSLYFGMTDPDVKALQEILRFEGLFPINSQITGYYGSITARGVLAFQKKYRVADDAELYELGGRLVGKKTLLKLNELYQ